MIFLRARRILLGATASILSGMLIVFILNNSQKPVELHARQAKKTSINNTLSVQGTLEPIRKSSISSSDFIVVKEVFVKTGDVVEQGEPLIRVEQSTGYQGDPFQILSVFLEQNKLEPAQTGAVLYADMDGVVTECAAVGEELYPMQTAVMLADFSQAVIEIEVPELYASGLSVGQSAKASPVSEQNTVFSGVLTEIDARITQKFSILEQAPERVVNCRITIPQMEKTRRPGTSMDVSIITDSVQNAVTVPYTGIHQVGAQEYIYVVSPDGIEKRAVQTGYHLASEIQIKCGVSDGEWVLVDEELPEGFKNGYTVLQT